MYQQERLIKVLNFLKTNKRISVEEICSMFNISRDTARRDLVILEKQGQVTRTHGGAILPNNMKNPKNYSERLESNILEKESIALKACDLVEAGDLIILDTSTTVQIFSKVMPDEDITSITTSINIADILSSKSNVKTILLGGYLNHNHKFLYGGLTLSMLDNFFPDKCFIGALGLSCNGLTVSDDNDAEVMRKIIEKSSKVIVLADSSKFNKTANYKVCDLDLIDILITDKLPSSELLDKLVKSNIQLILT